MSTVIAGCITQRELVSVNSAVVNCAGRQIPGWICQVQLLKPLLPWICFSTTNLLNLKLFIRNGMNNFEFFLYSCASSIIMAIAI